MSAREDAVGGPRVVVVHEPDDASDSSAAEGSSEAEEERWQESKGPDLPSEYWHIQKLVKYMKVSCYVNRLCTPRVFEVTREMDGEEGSHEHSSGLFVDRCSNVRTALTSIFSHR